MPRIIPVDSIDDPRIECYTRLKERDLAASGRRFIAEGELVVRRLLASRYAVESVLVSSRKVERIAPLAGEQTLIYTAAPEMVSRIVGFEFHSGVMAVGVRGQPLRVAEAARFWSDRRQLTLMILPEISKTDNLGALLRVGAAFGVDAVILGERCCNPFYRQAVRVSMGAVFELPVVESDDLLRDIGFLRENCAVQCAATVVDADAVPLRSFRRGPRLGVLFGNESQGLSAEYVRACDVRLTIPMRRNVDSLNVAVAAGVVMYALT